jgi:DNA-binding NarL/FixJ family response regulator
MKATKVLPVDDYEMVRQGLRHMLEADNEIEMVAEAASFARALKQAGAFSQVNLVVLTRAGSADPNQVAFAVRAIH